MVRITAQVKAHVQLQSCCSQMIQRQLDFQVAAARLHVAVYFAEQETGDITKHDIPYLMRRHDLVQDRFIAVTATLHEVLINIVLLYEDDKNIQRQCLAIIYRPYPEIPRPKQIKDPEKWFSQTCNLAEEAIKEGLVKEIEELNRLVFDYKSMAGRT